MGGEYGYLGGDCRETGERGTCAFAHVLFRLRRWGETRTRTLSRLIATHSYTSLDHSLDFCHISNDVCIGQAKKSALWRKFPELVATRELRVGKNSRDYTLPPGPRCNTKQHSVEAFKST